MKAIWVWISKYTKLIGAGILVLGSAIAAIVMHFKDQKIDQLQYQLAVSQTKLQIEALAAKYKVTIAELNDLRQKDAALDTQIAKVEGALTKKLQPNMTAEEIVQKFKELGIESKVVKS